MNKRIKLGTTRVVEVKKDMDVEVTIKIAGRGPKAIKLQQTIVHRLASNPDGEGIKEVEDVFIWNTDIVEETEEYLIVKHVKCPLSHRVIEEVKEEITAPVVETTEEKFPAAEASEIIRETEVVSPVKKYLNRYEQNALEMLMKERGLFIPFTTTNSLYYFPEKEIFCFRAKNEKPGELTKIETDKITYGQVKRAVPVADRKMILIEENIQEITEEWSQAPTGYDTWVSVDLENNEVSISHQTTSTRPGPDNEEYVVSLPFIYDVADECDDGTGHCEPDDLRDDVMNAARKALGID